MTLWFISDTHFGHENIIRYCGRPFADAQEMDEILIARWNEVVRPFDHVYHLGDVAIRQEVLTRVMPRLLGKKRLVRGNHDIFKTRIYAKYFEEIHGMRVFDHLLFSHVPVHPHSLGRFRANVHGHTHAQPDYPGGYLNVSVERTDYRPISLEEIQRRVAPIERVIAPK